MSLMPPVHAEAEIRNLRCGSCQWFSSGYKGASCSKLRNVVVTMPACIEYQAITTDAFSFFSSDKYLIGVRTDIKSAINSNSHQAWRSEMQNYIIHASSINFSAGQATEVNSLKELLKTVIGYRDRVTEIVSSLILEQSEVEELEEKAYIWLVSKYEVVREYKNEKLKQVAVSRALPELTTIKSEIERTLKLAKYIDDKLDKNDRTITKLLETAKSTYFNPNKI